MFFKYILAIVRLCFAIVKASLGILLCKAIVILLSPIYTLNSNAAGMLIIDICHLLNYQCSPSIDEQDHELPTPNSDTGKHSSRKYSQPYYRFATIIDS